MTSNFLALIFCCSSCFSCGFFYDFGDSCSQECEQNSEKFRQILHSMGSQNVWTYNKNKKDLETLVDGHCVNPMDRIRYAMLKQQLYFCTKVDEFITSNSAGSSTQRGIDVQSEKKPPLRTDLANLAMTMCSDECDLIYRMFVEGKSDSTK